MQLPKKPIAVVSYLNSKPYLYGLEKTAAAQFYAPLYATPAECARLVLTQQAQIGLIPSAALPELGEYYLLPEFCLGSHGPVKTVCLFSSCPLTQVRRILLDSNSRSSVAMLRVLLSRYWKCAPELVSGGSQPWVGIDAETAALVIGDQAITLLGAYPHEYDLALEWKRFSGLPFVFAVWASRTPIAGAEDTLLRKAFSYGVSQIPELCRSEPWGALRGFDVVDYLTNCISFKFDAAMQQGLALFLELLRAER